MLIVILFIIFIAILLEKHRSIKEVIILTICFSVTIIFIANFTLYFNANRKLPEMEKENIVALFNIEPNNANNIKSYILPHKGEYNLVYGFEFQNTSNEIVDYYIKSLQYKEWILKKYNEDYKTYYFKNVKYPGFYFYVISDVGKNNIKYGMRIDTEEEYYYDDIKNNKSLKLNPLDEFIRTYK